MSYPHVFGNQPGPIPLSYLDDNFNAIATGAVSPGFTPATVYGPGTVGLALKSRFTSATDAGFDCDPTGAVDSTAGFKALFQQTLDQSVFIPPGTYKVTSIDATPPGDLAVWAYGATFVNTTQVAVNGTPILRLRGGANDITILGLQTSGPRLTSDTTVGSGTYSTTGYPSGIDIYAAKRATLRDCRSNGTFYAGIEAHYITADLLIENCRSNNHGYAGVLWSDTKTSVVTGCDVDDVGSTIVVDGYGFTAATSYNSPAAGTNDVVTIVNNRATNCKRKAFDAHNALNLVMAFNTARGFGNSGYYAVGEGVDKTVRSVRIIGNKCSGDVTFVAAATGNAFDLGLFGGVATEAPSFLVEGNEVADLVAVATFACNNATTAQNVKQFKVANNTVRNSTFDYGVTLANNTPGVFETVDVSHNDWIDCVLNTGWANLRKYSALRFSDNGTSGTTGMLGIGLDNPATAIVERNTQDGVLTPAALLEVYGSGLLVETTQTFGVSVSNLDVLSCDLGVVNDATVLVQVDVSEVQGVGATGATTYTYNATGVRTGAGSPVWAPASATAMTLVTTVYGTAVAPKLIWNVVGTVGTLQFQPQDAFASYIVRARAVTWRGSLTTSVR